MCGPAAAIAFVRANGGRTPSLEEARILAHQMGIWTQKAGMAGPVAQQQLMRAMGVDTTLEGSNWAKAAETAGRQRPVAISTSKHYFVASDRDSMSGKLFVGTSGTDMKGGSEWLTPQEIEALGGGVNGMLYNEDDDEPIGISQVSRTETARSLAPSTTQYDFLSKAMAPARKYTATKDRSSGYFSGV